MNGREIILRWFRRQIIIFLIKDYAWRAFKDDLFLCIQLLSSIEIEMDACLIVNFINKGTNTSRSLSPLVDDCRPFSVESPRY